MEMIEAALVFMEEHNDTVKNVCRYSVFQFGLLVASIPPFPGNTRKPS